jgi:hypothetical protein
VTNLVRLDVRITAAEMSQLRALAAARGCSVAGLVRSKLRGEGMPIPVLLRHPSGAVPEFSYWRTLPPGYK